MWRLPVEAAQKLFVFREKFRKYQDDAEIRESKCGAGKAAEV
jgi:hypothetical protein